MEDRAAESYKICPEKSWSLRSVIYTLINKFTSRSCGSSHWEFIVWQINFTHIYYVSQLFTDVEVNSGGVVDICRAVHDTYIYILLDGLTYNTRGYFASCVVYKQ